jgi:hypothetical protein
MFHILRYSHDAYGQAKLDGISWDLLPIFFWGALAIIVLHLVISAARKKR